MGAQPDGTPVVFLVGNPPGELGVAVAVGVGVVVRVADGVGVGVGVAVGGRVAVGVALAVGDGVEVLGAASNVTSTQYWLDRQVSLGNAEAP